MHFTTSLSQLRGLVHDILERWRVRRLESDWSITGEGFSVTAVPCPVKVADLVLTVRIGCNRMELPLYRRYGDVATGQVADAVEALRAYEALADSDLPWDEMQEESNRHLGVWTAVRARLHRALYDPESYDPAQWA